MKDSVVESVIQQLKDRSEVGIKKYNTTLDRTDLTLFDWLEMAKQEALDFSLYIQRVQNELQYVEQKIDNLKKEEHVKQKYAWHR